MANIKYLVLGAGPAGLAFANKLLMAGKTSFYILEKEKEAGGLCRSKEVDGAPLDIGGGHFLDTRYQEVKDFLFKFLPEDEWNTFERDARIVLSGLRVLHYPLEANLWELDTETQVAYLASIARAGCSMGEPKPADFQDWIIWKFGTRIGADYMLPINRKMFADDLDSLGTYWLDHLPNVSFEGALRSCLERRAFEVEMGHEHFLYPKKYGYGEVWRRMADKVKDHVLYGTTVCGLDFENRVVTTMDGGTYQADVIITTIPWQEFATLGGMPDGIAAGIKGLRHSSVEVRYHEQDLSTRAHWIYIPDETYPFYRMLPRPSFCPGSMGYLMETRLDRVSMFPEEDNFRHVNDYAYPLITVYKRDVMQGMMDWAAAQHVYGLGQWGEHEHLHSDAVVRHALQLAAKLG